MPPVIAFAAAAFTAAVFGTTAAAVTAAAAAGTISAVTVTFAVAETVLEVGLVIGISLLIPKPPSIQQQIPIKQAQPPRRAGYGRARLSGFYMLFQSYRDEAQDVLAMHHGQIDGWERFFLNDDEVHLGALTGTGLDQYNILSPDGTKYGHNNDQVYVSLRTGAPGQTATLDIFLGLPAGIWTASCVGDGIAYSAWRYVQASESQQQKVFPNGCPQPSIAGRLTRTYDPRLNGTTSMGDPTTWTWNQSPVCALIDFLTSPTHGMGLDFGQFIQPNIAMFIAAADVCDEPIEVAAFSTFTGDATAIGHTNVDLNSVQGLSPGMTMTLGVGSSDVETKVCASISGNRVFLTTPTGHAHPQGDEVQWAGNGLDNTVDRYLIGGAFDFTTDPAEVVADILGTFDGWLGQSGAGPLKLYAGQYYAPTVTLSDDHILGYSVQHFTTDEEAVNQLLPTFTDPNFLFGTVDAGTWDDLADQDARGKLRSKPMDLPWVPNRSQARRLAKRMMTRFGAELRGTVKTNLYGLNALGERYIQLQITDNQALTNIPVEISKVKIDLATLTLTFSWTAADPTIDEWSVQEETGLAGPLTLSGQGAVQPNPGFADPVITAVSVVNAPVSGAGTGSQLSVVASSDPGQNLNWIVRTAPTGTTDWTSQTLTDVPDGASVTLTTPFVAQGGSTDVQVAYVTAGGQSGWSNTWTIDTPLTAPTVGASSSQSAAEALGAPAAPLVSAGPAGWRNANASDASRQVDGFVLAPWAMGAVPTVFTGGTITGLAGLTEGATYFLDTAAGGITLTPPAASGNWLQEIGRAVSATELTFAPKTGTVIE